MFCAKLKELKISGECPFSASAKNNELGDFEERSTETADLLPVSKDVHGKTGEGVPRKKTSRAKVNLHTLGDSIRKLACPEVSYKCISYSPHVSSAVFYLDLWKNTTITAFIASIFILFLFFALKHRHHAPVSAWDNETDKSYAINIRASVIDV